MTDRRTDLASASAFRRMWLVMLGGVGLLSGCAPQTIDRGAPWLVQKHHTTDAHVQTVRDMPFLRVNAYLLDRMDSAGRAHDVAEARGQMTRVLGACHRLAIESITNEIDRLPPEAIERGWRLFFSDEPPPNEPGAAFRDRYLAIVESDWNSFLTTVSAAKSHDDVVALAKSIRKRVNPSVKDRHGAGPLLAMIVATIDEPQGPLDLGGPDVDVYEPDPGFENFAPVTADAAAASEQILLARFAPRIVQERVADAPYAQAADRIGSVRLDGAHDHLSVSVDTSTPRVYAYAQPTMINDTPHTQLTYTFWFPERPALKPGDVEAGAVDGATLRITLDRSKRPAIFETILNCGCYHRCYVSAELDAAANQAFGPPPDGKTCSVARRMNGSPDWVVADTVSIPKEAQIRPIIFCRAGYHAIAGISFDENLLRSRNVGVRRFYQFTPYAELEHLPTSYGRGSMFGSDGLVHQAGRIEGWLLAGTGMLSAGQPRQRGTQRICWDHYDFDDPHLLERCLRLPPDF